ncbi:MAG: DNA polymerase III subunit chi [Deltaproteobacteria bacterium]|nr:DNA polymerase III subunit chi [Deltaproteobacteria bacterium]
MGRLPRRLFLTYDPPMAGIDFYEVKGPRWELAVCERVEALYEAGERVYVRAPSEALARALDDLLWTFREDSFVPHRLWGGEGDLPDPVAVGWRRGNPNGATCLVLAGAGEPEELSGFAQAFDFVPVSDPELTAGARERYRAFRAAGHQVTFRPAPS